MPKKTTEKAERPWEKKRAIIVGVPFYDEHELVLQMAAERRMKKAPFLREVFRAWAGLDSAVERSASVKPDKPKPKR